ncbi:hypothetical protein SLE2022_044250 [Rubroshorea leprosula]
MAVQTPMAFKAEMDFDRQISMKANASWVQWLPSCESRRPAFLLLGLGSLGFLNWTEPRDYGLTGLAILKPTFNLNTTTPTVLAISTPCLEFGKHKKGYKYTLGIRVIIQRIAFFKKEKGPISTN